MAIINGLKIAKDGNEDFLFWIAEIVRHVSSQPHTHTHTQPEKPPRTHFPIHSIRPAIDGGR